MTRLYLSFYGISRLHADAAGVSSGELDVPSFSPGGSPGVLDVPVAVCGASEHNSVVEELSAVAEDAAHVWRPVGGINRHSERSARKGTYKVSAIFCHPIVSDLEVSGGLFASLIFGNVGILTLENDPVLNDKQVGVYHLTSITSTISEARGTVDELLLRETFKSSIGELREAFQSPDCGEGPTRSALSLVLHRRYSPFSRPVDGAQLQIVNALDAAAPAPDDGPEVGLHELLLRQRRELVEAHIVGPRLVFVVSSDFGEVLQEDFFAIGVFGVGGVGDVVLGFPGFEVSGVGRGLVVEV